jgi:hypothetical protein
VTRNGETYDVIRWPDNHKTAAWWTSMREAGTQTFETRKDEIEFNRKYQQILKPHPARDYVVLRSVAPRPHCGGSACSTAYRYEHLFLVKHREGDEPTLETATREEHKRYAILFNESLLDYKNAPAKFKKTLMNEVVKTTAPDGTEAFVPLFSTAVASFETYYRSKSVVGDHGLSRDELAKRMRPAAGKNVFKEALAQPAEVTRGGVAGPADEPEAKRTKPATAAAPAATKPATAPKSANSRAAADHNSNVNPDLMVFFDAIRPCGLRRMRARNATAKQIAGATVLESVFGILGLPPDVDKTEAEGVQAAWEATSDRVAKQIEELKRRMAEGPSSAEMLAEYESLSRTRFYQLAFMHASYIANPTAACAST